MFSEFSRAQCREEARYDFAWDDWGYFEQYFASSTGYEKQLANASPSALLAISIGVSSLILDALQEHDQDNKVRKYLDASWCVFSDRHRLIYHEPIRDDWRCPQKSVLYLIMTLINDQVHRLDIDTNVAMRTDWILSLGFLVFPKTGSFAKLFRRMLAFAADVSPKKHEIQSIDPQVVYQSVVIGELFNFGKEPRDNATLADHLALNAENGFIISF